ncbi:leucyl/phenylalanyl-tRNA--protein transferase [Acetobacterium malicum]|uniref:leucyl/phenylalanyl-tRNA--protein transferase n=1 Tax=Acetobacterium malicum TaxID=52692 RepID=UPI00164AB187|nr:leucyl/phenylalanyl-tRNA--protein transferase [Acetobacterium malicum]
MTLKKFKSGLLRLDDRILKGKLKSFYTRRIKYWRKAYVLTQDLYFPPHTASNKNIRMGPEGELLAIGGDWEPERIILAYKNGIYPVVFRDQPILWWTSERHCVMYPKDVHIPKNMRALIRQDKFKLTADKAFYEVVNACSETRKEYTWLTDEQVQAFHKLYDLGFAHSVEVWQDEKLVGGLFGISFGSYFHGESMFARVSHTSKLAYIGLSIRLAEMNFDIMDCGIWPTEHMKSLGAVVISRDEFLEILDKSKEAPEVIADWGALFENWDLKQAVQNHLDGLTTKMEGALT